jgi:Arc/MetJ-type ribon-helix-helix transcriptional regulator
LFANLPCRPDTLKKISLRPTEKPVVAPQSIAAQIVAPEPVHAKIEQQASRKERGDAADVKKEALKELQTPAAKPAAQGVRDQFSPAAPAPVAPRKQEASADRRPQEMMGGRTEGGAARGSGEDGPSVVEQLGAAVASVQDSAGGVIQEVRAERRGRGQTSRVARWAGCAHGSSGL